MNDLTPREKWRLFIAGRDVGPMVSPLCDDWSLDRPYAWPYDGPDPFPPGHRWHALSQQIAMAKVCGWDPTFLAKVDFLPRNADVLGRTTTTPIAGGVRTDTVIHTPFGDLTASGEHKTTDHIIKAMVSEEADYRRMAWVVRQTMDYDENLAVAQGREQLAAVGDRGVLGIECLPPLKTNGVNSTEMIYHPHDWPVAFAELRIANRDLILKKLSTYRKAGYDYLFYAVDSTEWISPDFFRRHIRQDTLDILRHWRKLGGWVLWHSCGHIRKFVELGFYNEFAPEVFETLSEPPVGDLPSLKWARQQLDKRIATKGNIPLDLLLHGTPEAVRADVRRVREQTAGYRHIVGLSDDPFKGTPLENIRAMVDEARAT